MGLNETIGNGITEGYSQILGFIPEKYHLAVTLFIYIIFIGVYSIFVFKFYRFLAKKDIIELNLKKYDKSAHPFFIKFFAFIFFIVEYVIVMPLLVFFWFAVLAFLLLLLSRGQSVSQILLISAAMIGAIRLASYFNEDLSRDLAKMFPFTVLAIFLLSPNPLEFVLVVDKFLEIPSFLYQILYYLGFIIIFETVIRLFSLPFNKKEEEK